MPSKRKMPELERKGFARRNERGKLVIDKEGYLKLLDHHGFSRENFAEAERRLSKHSPSRIAWHGDMFKPERYAPIYAFFLKRFAKTGLKGKKFLELGFGGTAFMEELASHGAVVKGLDINPASAKKEIATEVGKVEDIAQHFKGERFDAVYASGLFHPGGGVKPIDELRTTLWDYQIAKRQGQPTTEIEKRLKILEGEITQVFKKVGSKLKQGGVLVLYGDHMVFPPNAFAKAGFRFLMRRVPLSESAAILALIKK